MSHVDSDVKNVRHICRGGACVQILRAMLR